jgi:hypothetical protein
MKIAGGREECVVYDVITGFVTGMVSRRLPIVDGEATT